MMTPTGERAQQHGPFPGIFISLVFFLACFHPLANDDILSFVGTVYWLADLQGLIHQPLSCDWGEVCTGIPGDDHLLYPFWFHLIWFFLQRPVCRVFALGHLTSSRPPCNGKYIQRCCHCTVAIPCLTHLGSVSVRAARLFPGHVTWRFRPMPCFLNNQTVQSLGQ